MGKDACTHTGHRLKHGYFSLDLPFVSLFSLDLTGFSASPYNTETFHQATLPSLIWFSGSETFIFWIAAYPGAAGDQLPNDCLTVAQDLNFRLKEEFKSLNSPKLTYPPPTGHLLPHRLPRPPAQCIRSSCLWHHSTLNKRGWSFVTSETNSILETSKLCGFGISFFQKLLLRYWACLCLKRRFCVLLCPKLSKYDCSICKLQLVNQAELN